MIYAAYKFRAEVDRVAVNLITERTTNAPTIYKIGGFSFVSPMNPSAGGAGTQYSVLIQNPKSWRQIEARIANVAEKCGLCGDPTLSLLEISLDAYLKIPGQGSLAELAARFYKYNTRPVSDNSRFSGKTVGGVMGITSYQQTVRLLASGRVINIGSTTDSVTQRIYVKTTDNGQEPLRIGLHRARTEVTLKDDALPITSIDEGREYNFTSLSDYFKFRKLKSSLQGPAALVGNYAPKLGTRGKRLSRDGGSRQYDGFTKADVELNRKAYDALRELTRRMAM